MFAKNFFLKLQQLHDQARQGLVGGWLGLNVLGKHRDRKERQTPDQLPTTSLISSPGVLEASGAEKTVSSPSTSLVSIKKMAERRPSMPLTRKVKFWW